MSDENIRYAYRICPCFSYDIEGIQTWLEDMASQGLVLEGNCRLADSPGRPQGCDLPAWLGVGL